MLQDHLVIFHEPFYVPTLKDFFATMGDISRVGGNATQFYNAKSSEMMLS